MNSLLIRKLSIRINVKAVLLHSSNISSSIHAERLLLTVVANFVYICQLIAVKSVVEFHVPAGPLGLDLTIKSRLTLP